MIIGLCGFARSGKSTVAEYLAKEHGFKRINFKDSLLEEVREKFPDLLRELSLIHDGDLGDIDWLFENKPPLMRALLQNYGTNVVRNKKPDYWVKKWMEKVKATKSNIVVDDVRFFNELSAIVEEDGVLIRVKRDDITSGGTHQSETEQELFVEDFTINGIAGSHDQVYAQIESILHTMKTNND